MHIFSDGLVTLQVQRLSTDFRAATRIVSEPLPAAANLPPGAAVLSIIQPKALFKRVGPEEFDKPGFIRD